MYLHIGKDCVINNKEIVGLFNLDYIKNTREYKALYENLEKTKDIVNKSDEDKTIIITEKKTKVKGYMSNISTTTLAKRS